jgi:hypothetical protein
VMNKSSNYTREDLTEFLYAFDIDDLPDGAWWAVLEEGAEAFIRERKLKSIDAIDLVHEYLEAQNDQHP